MAIYRSSLERELFLQFLELHKRPIVSTFDMKILQDVFKPNGKKAVFLFRYAGAEGMKEIEEEFQKAATIKRSHELIFVKSDIREGIENTSATFLEIDPKMLPYIEYIHQKDETIRYKFTEKITQSSVMRFVEMCKRGLSQRYIKSELIPAENPGPIYKVVGNSFSKEVMQNDLDILVLFHTPWCLRCKDFMQIYKELASSLIEHKKLKLVEIDYTKNDVPGQVLNNFPTLKLFPGKSKMKVFTYEGELTTEGITSFLKGKCSYPLSAVAKDESKKSDL